ncbi:hypothetical protein BKA70DRAFT_1296143 [Coprinopsis sp. MPI-PUGE-AT-0042]|nr:hypothetical protein BKA70DRAFT_1296143 [Coprinopsis sp. MPI-PUGE-AT-0042]
MSAEKRPDGTSTLHENRSRCSVKSVRMDPPPPISTVHDGSPSSSSSSCSSSSETASAKSFWKQLDLGKEFGWVTGNWQWSKLKHVVRCAIAGWIAVVLFAIPDAERWMGQAAFLILMASFFSPPNDAFMAVLERETLIILFVAIGWAWCCLGIKFADMSRGYHDPTVTFVQALSGDYIEAAPSVILGIWICLGSIFFLYIKAKQGPGPYLFASIFACVCIDISMTTAVFFPFPYYDIGKSIMIPLGLHSCIALVCSIFIFPHTISATFTTRLQGVLSPLISGLSLQRSLFSPDQYVFGTPEFTEAIGNTRAATEKSEAGLVAVAAAGRLLENDLIYSRFSPEDFRAFQQLARRMSARAHGLTTYFALIDPSRETFPTYSVPNTPAPGTPRAVSRHHSPERGSRRGRSTERSSEKEDERGRSSRAGSPTLSRVVTPSSPLASPTNEKANGHFKIPTSSTLQSSVSFSPLHQIQTGNTMFTSLAKTHSHGHSHSHQHSPSHSHSHNHRHGQFSHLLQASLSNLALKSKRRKTEHAVGVFESQQYLNLEAKRLHDPRSEEYTNLMLSLLGECSEPLLEQNEAGLSAICEWLGTVRRGRWNIFQKAKDLFEKDRLERVQKLKETRDELESRLNTFRNDTRMKVLEPYKLAFDHSAHPEDEDDQHIHDADAPPHRHLFRCYVYQYHLTQFAEIVIETLDEIDRLEKERTQCKLWTPVTHLFQWTAHDVPEDYDNDHDDDPDIIQGTRPMDYEGDLGLPKRRDPDALPPRNVLEWLMSRIHRASVSLWAGNSLFAIKAGFISLALCLPFLLKHTAAWSYHNRWVWAVIMGQLTIARFRGDTVFGLSARIIATFAGGCVGMAMWYISTGAGEGSAYGLAAVCLVCFPFFFFVRLYSPMPPMTNIILFATAILVIGYSYQNKVQPTPGNPGFGWDVAWKRFVLVTVGVVAAFFAALLPPTMTLRRYQRSLLSTTANEIGAVYCSVISSATNKKDCDVQAIMASLVATRAKLKKGQVLSINIIYEFSLRGRWPKARYQQILDLQLAILYSLSHLLSALGHMEPAWTRAFLRRARFLDSDFQGDVLAVLTMVSSSLRTGCALPQITPCPLLDRFTLRNNGLDVIHRDAEEDFGLPRLLTMETLQDEQYQIFCVAISTAFGIINRLDKLMLAAKELVGEQFHIHGIGVSTSVGGGGPIAFNSIAQQFQPPRDV